MNISGIRGYAGLYSSVNKANENLNSPINENAVQNTNPVSSSNGRPYEDFSTRISNEQSVKGAQEFNEKFDPLAEYSLSGADSDIELLDRPASVSEDKKAQILGQYQRFIGTSEAVGSITARQTVSNFRPMENFDI